MTDRRLRIVHVAFALLAVLASSRAWASTLPPGFTQTRFLPLQGPTGIAFDPDGGLWVSRIYLDSSVWLYRNSAMARAVVLPVASGGERGVGSVAVDPDYAQNGRIWVYYTADNPPHNRLSYFTNSGWTLVNEVVVVEGPHVQSVFHNGGCLAFASDKTLYLGIGDDLGGSDTAQNPFDLRGKILHINRDGTPAWDNPFRDGAAGDPRVWALGLRNPFRCSVQPGTDALFVGDVGAGSWEEIDIGVAGANLGWSNVEGPEPSGLPGYLYPVYSYPHAVAGESYAVMAGKHVPAGALEPAYEGNYFFADWAQSTIWRLVLDENNQVLDSELWGTNEHGPSDLAFGPDGALYYAGSYGEGVYRIAREGGGDREPIARLSATPQSGPAPLDVLFDASASSDPDGDPLTYSWDFGDGSSATGQTAGPHRYEAGAYAARVTVVDGRGGSATSPPTRIVSGNEPPKVTLAGPSQGTRYVAGQAIPYWGEATDAEEGALACSRYSWQVLFHHSTHAHPFLGPILGSCSGSFTTAERGEAAPDTWYELRVTASDTGVPLGTADAVLSATESVEIHPLLSRMTFETAPLPDLTLTLDGVPFTPPRSVDGVVNLIREIGAVDDQTSNGRRYRFRAWSDEGSRSHEIRTPAVVRTFTAQFGCNVLEPVERLQMDKGPDGYLVLTWPPIDDACLDGMAGYRVYVGSSLRPSSEPGSFPDDPPFVRIADVPDSWFSYVPIPSDRYFLVVPVGTDGQDGPVGHYEPMAP